MHTDILIIGAGPTGLMTACQLARFGINFIIIDSKSGINAESRAMLVTARSMEIYQQMGLSDKVVAEGKYLQDIAIYMSGKEITKLSLGKAGEGLTDFPFIQSFEQSRNESLLYEQLKACGHDILWGTEFLDVEQSTTGVTALLRDLPSNKSVSIQAKYLVGCDGASSPVRRKLNCKFKGGTYQNKFFVADTEIEWGQPPHEVIASPSRSNFCAFFPMYQQNTYRVLGTLPKAYSDQKAVGFNDLEAVIKKTTGIPLEFKVVNWFSVYQLHHRCVETFRIGRCFLAGDAAHVHSPAGGQGMNTGLQDAYNLSWKLWLVINGAGGEKLLATYHNERFPFAQWLLKFTDRIFGLMTSSNPMVYRLRKYLMPLIFKLVSGSPRLKRHLFRTISQIWYSYRTSPLSLMETRQAIKFKAGDRMPYIQVEHEGQRQCIYRSLTAPKFHLITIDDEFQRVNIPDTLKSYIKVVSLPVSPDWAKLCVKNRLYILVRPDNYIGLITDEMDEHRLAAYFRLYQ